MSPNKSPNIIKYCAITSTSEIVLIVIYLITVSRKALDWNLCLDLPLRGINENENDFKRWETKAIESLAVAVCNGAVYQPKLDIN